MLFSYLNIPACSFVSSIPSKMAFPVLFMSCCSLLLLMDWAKSEVFTVGDDNLWSDGYAYDLWSQKYSFHVGDVLEFKYGIGAHNVYEVTKATYQSCDASTGVLAKYESGDDKIELKEARPYWFLCNIQGHCLGGMRFGLNATTTGSAAALSPSQMANNAPPPPPPPPSSKASRGTIHATWALIFIVIINIMLRV